MCGVWGICQHTEDIPYCSNHLLFFLFLLHIQFTQHSITMGDGKARTTLQQASDRISAIANTITGRPTHNFPEFDQLAKVEGQPQGCIWGHFDKDGKKDEVGSETSRYISFV